MGFSWVALSATLIADLTSSSPKVTTYDWLALIAFITNVLLLFGNVMQRIYMPQTKVVGLIEAGIEPPYIKLVRGCSPWDTTSVDRCIEDLGGKVVINVPSSLKEFLEALKKRVGTYTLASALLALIDMLPSYRKSLAELRREQRTLKEMAREFVSAEFWRYIARPTIGKIVFWSFLVLIGVAIGYFIGSTWAVSTTPPPWWNATQAVTHHSLTPAPPPTLTTRPTSLTPAPPPTLTTATRTSLTPATPPPPTGG